MLGLCVFRTRDLAWLRSALWRRWCSGVPAGAPCWFAVLGVPADADDAQIKAAFRKRAKQLHPDANPTTRHDRAALQDFALLVTAYEELREPWRREQYRRRLAEHLRSGHTRTASEQHGTRWGGAAGSSRARGERGEEEEELVLQWGALDRWLNGSAYLSAAGLEAASPLDVARARAAGDLRAALRVAAFGPQLERPSEQALPECFEADERGAAGLGDLLHVVHGRQLLGVVRERRAQLLHGPDGRYFPPQPHGMELQPLAAAQIQPPSVGGAAEASPAMRNEHHNAVPGASGSGGRQHKKRERDTLVLEVVLGGQVVVAGMRPQLEARGLPGRLQPGIQFFRGDAPAGSVLRGRLRDAAGRHTHTVLHTVTPLVQHLHVLAEGAGKRTCVGRCQRAWLPPAATWLFKPRAETHNVGGWYFEVPGYEQRHRAAWLDPALLLLIAGYETWDREQAALAAAGTPRDGWLGRLVRRAFVAT